MATIQVLYTGDYTTQTTHSAGNTILTHTHLQEGEEPKAYTPMQLLAVAAASCTLSSIGVVAKIHGIPVDGMKATVDFSLHTKPSRLDTINITIDFTNHTYDDRQKKFLRLATQHCTVMQSLAPEVQKNIEFLFA